MREARRQMPASIYKQGRGGSRQGAVKPRRNRTARSALQRPVLESTGRGCWRRAWHASLQGSFETGEGQQGRLSAHGMA